jgi:C4-dicarboxylate-specific signal transduction histidine kinase
VDTTAEETPHLRRCLNDLVVVLALPAVWSGQAPSHIARTLVDVLVRMLCLEFAYVTVNESAGGSRTEWARSSDRRDVPPQEIGRVLNAWLRADVPDPIRALPNPVGNGLVSIAVFRLGVQQEVGRLIAGCKRADFPTKIEQLIMQVAANQAAIGLQELQHARQQKDATAEKARRELAQVSRRATLAAMTASLTHEIQQPLTEIVTNGAIGSRWLEGAEPDLDELRLALKNIVDAGQRASDVIANIGAMLRKDRREAMSLDANALVLDVLALVRAELESQRISVQPRLGTDLPTIVGERVPLQQVLLNLIMNAVDAMSSVTDRARQLSIQTETYLSDHVLITVADAGPGIDPADMPHIFEAFFTTKPDGLGMGLSICRSIVEAHGGRLNCGEVADGTVKIGVSARF